MYMPFDDRTVILTSMSSHSGSTGSSMSVPKTSSPPSWRLLSMRPTSAARSVMWVAFSCHWVKLQVYNSHTFYHSTPSKDDQIIFLFYFLYRLLILTILSYLFSLQIIYKMEYNKNKAKGYTIPYDTPYQQHIKKVKEITSNVSPPQLNSVNSRLRTTAHQHLSSSRSWLDLGVGESFLFCCYCTAMFAYWTLFGCIWRCVFHASSSWSTGRCTRRARLRSTWILRLTRSVQPRRRTRTSATWVSPNVWLLQWRDAEWNQQIDRWIDKHLNWVSERVNELDVSTNVLLGSLSTKTFSKEISHFVCLFVCFNAVSHFLENAKYISDITVSQIWFCL